MCLALPGQILRIEEEDGVPMAEVNFGGVEKRVCLQYLPDAIVGEYVVVHVGFAIQRLDEASALATLANFTALGILDEELGDGRVLAHDQEERPTTTYRQVAQS
jgi:hydrogenase expression/formation protein HypC